jgi:hypothetical protein
LESVCRGNSTEGSNPSLSANYKMLNKPPQAPEKQAGPNQEHHGQRHFRDDERVADPGPPRAAGHATAPFTASCRSGRES